MEIRLLETFCVVAELENITQAAAELNFTQPTVSAQIRSLEEELGVTLFERRHKRIYLSPAGRFFLTPAKQLVALYHDTCRQLTHFQAEQELRVGLSSNYVNLCLSGALRQLAAEPAGTTHVAIAANTQAVLQGLKRHQYDIGLVHDTVEDTAFQTILLLTEPMYWVGCGAAVPQLGQQPILQFRQGCTFYRRCAVVLGERQWAASVEYSDFDAVKQAVRDGVGIALLPESVAQQLCQEQANRWCSLEPLAPPITVYAVWTAGIQLQAAGQRLLQLLATAVR